MVYLNAEIQQLNKGIDVDFGSSILFAFSPIAKVEQLANGDYLITITDKNGTTTALIPTVTYENIDNIITRYFSQHSILTDAIQAHNESELAHEDLRNLITAAINRIPQNISQLNNDLNYVKSFKEMIVSYNSYFQFPNIPPESQRDKIFLDKSTNDLYVFGLGNSLTYTSIGLANDDIIYGGDSSF